MTEPVAPQPVSRQTVAQWAEQVYAARRQAAQLTEYADTLTAMITEALGVGFDDKCGTRKVRIGQSYVFDPVRALRELTPAERAACTKTETVLDQNLVRATLAPERFAKCRKPRGKPSVRIE